MFNVIMFDSMYRKWSFYQQTMGSSPAQPLMLMQQLTMWTSEEVVQTHQPVAFFVYGRRGATPHPLWHLYGRRLVPLGGGPREAANARLPGLL